MKIAGFTLIEAMIVMAVTAVISLAIMSMLQMGAQGTRNVLQQADAIGIQNLIEMDLNVGGACGNTMTMQTAPLTFPVATAGTASIPIAKILTATTPVPQTIAAVAPATPSVFNSVTISSMVLQNLVPNGANNYVGNLVITASANGLSLGAQAFKRNVPVLVSVSVAAGVATIVGCSGSSGAVTNNMTASRVFYGIYQNTSGHTMFVSGSGIDSGSSVGNISCLIGPLSPPTLEVFSTEATATVVNGDTGFAFMVPNGYYYQVQNYGAVNMGLRTWIETLF